GFQKRTTFVDYLATYGLIYNDEAVGMWERGLRRPVRDKLLTVLQALAARQGIITLKQANEILLAAEYAPLKKYEEADYDLMLPHDIGDNNLPPRSYEQLIGREEKVDEVLNILRSPDGKPVVMITGLGGIGKTALAHEVVAK